MPKSSHRRLGGSGVSAISIIFDGSCCTIDAKKESHMHAMTVRFDDADTITTSCSAIMEGKAMPDHATMLKRVKS